MPDIDRVAYVPVTTLTAGRNSVPLDEVVLKFADEENMIQAPAPLPGRKEEIRALIDRLGLPE